MIYVECSSTRPYKTRERQLQPHVNSFTNSMSLAPTTLEISRPRGVPRGLWSIGRLTPV